MYYRRELLGCARSAVNDYLYVEHVLSMSSKKETAQINVLCIIVVPLL